MSTSLSPRSSGHPTRQQLDELDALLQRMLALPVNQAGDGVTAEIDAPPKMSQLPGQESVSYRTPDFGENEQLPAQTEEADAEPAAPPRLDDAHVSSTDEGQDDPDNWVRLSSTWKPSPHTWKPLAQSWQQPRTTPVSKPAQESPPSGEEALETPAPETVPGPPLSPVEIPASPSAMARTYLPAPKQEEPPLAGWLLPVLWLNIVFDWLLLPWGPPGRWLRRDGGGRTLLGVLGGLLLVAAVALSILEWFRWTWE
jgi:hypothetical protein